MKTTIVAFLSGIIFSVGLVISGMVNPHKVIGFLDVFGEWDISLMFVMGGAVSFNLIAFRLVTKRDKPFFSENWHLPTASDLDKKLLIGSALFGIGWGIAGICPGPGIVNLVTLKLEAFYFVLSMIMGMLLFHFTKSVWEK